MRADGVDSAALINKMLCFQWGVGLYPVVYFYKKYNYGRRALKSLIFPCHNPITDEFSGK